MLDIKTFKTQDLVLRVSKNYDVLKLDLSHWDSFLDVLCQNRNYQKEAIKTAIIYLFSGKYKNIESLISENYPKSEHLQERYKDIKDYHKKIQLPQKLSATIDLATGTGKSYVMYGIAQIALGLGLVDKVLLLCPSLTIEKGLTEKFDSFASGASLKNEIPQNAIFKNPRIIDASQTIKAGDICIENIHAIYHKNSSSILDSLGFGKGEKCLVLSDESHHIYNKIFGNDGETKSIKKWKEFLVDSAYQFQYMLGFTGTAYIDNEYFNDVIYRYSLKQAINENIVKTIEYVAKDDETKEKDEKYQKIYQNHLYNKKIYPKIKPLTILITQDIKLARQVTEILCEFLTKKENTPINEIRKNKVLLVTSHKDHENNVKNILPYVDNTDNNVEWIVSVSMLTEGWDVKNVFQIVPMEERAFNSKLLIAQVLGRGLRLPLAYPNAQVTIFNHDNWTSKIQKLVDELLEIEMKLYANPLKNGEERSKYHFDLYNLSYERIAQEKEAKKTTTFDYSKELIQLQSQIEEYNPDVVFQNVKGEIKERTYHIAKEMFSVDKIVEKIFETFTNRKFEAKAIKLATGEEYTQENQPPRTSIEAIIRKSMEKVGISGDFLDKKNYQIIISSFQTLLRENSKTITYEKKPNPIFLVNTCDRETEGLSISNLRRDSTVFYAKEDWETEIQNEEVKMVLREIIGENSKLPRNASKSIQTVLFKTSTDLVFTSSEPERKFVDLLCKKDNAGEINAWFKSKNQKLYEIEYTLTTEKGNHTKHPKFNPDFFIQIKKNGFSYIIVVEIKSDNDNSLENIAKYKYAKQHFEELNNILITQNITQKYIFHFLSPSDYEEFFVYLRDERLLQENFRSGLENLLTATQN